jgi:hypothetical protein
LVKDNVVSGEILFDVKGSLLGGFMLCLRCLAYCVDGRIEQQEVEENGI